MPQLVRPVAQSQTMIRWNDLAVLTDGREHRKIGACASRADFGYFGSSETSRERELAFVSHVLTAKHQNGMFFERRAHCSVCGIVHRDVAQCNAAQLGSKTR